MNLGYYNSAGQHVPFVNERPFDGTYLIGKRGVGKTTALINYALEDIEAGERVIFFERTT